MPRYIVLLEEIGGPRCLKIWVGEAEGVALALELEKSAWSRPLTYAFAATILQAAGGRLQEVRIDRLEGDVFFATAVVESRGKTRDVDARPSDALNLALLLSASIRVDEAVLEAAGNMQSDEEWTELPERTDGPRSIAADVLAGWQRSSPQAAEEAETA